MFSSLVVSLGMWINNFNTSVEYTLLLNFNFKFKTKFLTWPRIEKTEIKCIRSNRYQTISGPLETENYVKEEQQSNVCFIFYVCCVQNIFCETTFWNHSQGGVSKNKAKQHVYISQKIKEKNQQFTSLVKYMSSDSHFLTTDSSAASNTIVKHGNPFSNGEYFKEAWLECAALYLFEDFTN